jgi:hypothetical protein
VHDDSDPDVLTSGPGMNGYFADLASRKRDTILEAEPGEAITRLGS